jgi:hypothetical protein
MNHKGTEDTEEEGTPKKREEKGRRGMRDEEQFRFQV